MSTVEVRWIGICVAILCIGFVIGSLQECHYEHERAMKCLELTKDPFCNRESAKKPLEQTK